MVIKSNPISIVSLKLNGRKTQQGEQREVVTNYIETNIQEIYQRVNPDKRCLPGTVYVWARIHYGRGNTTLVG